jgi:iron complex outermembrane receptor protein
MLGSRKVVRWWFVALLAGVLPLRAADTGTVDGRLTRTDGAPLAGVSVSVGDLPPTITDSAGRFLVGGVPAGKVTVVLRAGDYSETIADLEVAANRSAHLERTLDWQLSFAETITVFSASRETERITEAPAAVTLIPAEDIEREASSGQLPKLLEFTPGAEVTQSGLYDFNFNVRGFNSSLNRRVATLVDGREPSVPFLGAQEWAAISFPLDDLARIELVRGPSAALYGANASSGVLNLVTKRPRDSEGGMVRLTGGELSTFNADLRWAGHLGGNWYGKLVGGARNSGDFTVSRTAATGVEYAVPCTVRGQTDCLPVEAVPLKPLDDDQISFGSARIDRYGPESGLFTLEGGTADVKGPVFQTGIGRVQLVDVQRPWARANVSTLHWNALVAATNRHAPKQTALGTGINLALDEERWKGELQTNWDLFAGKARVVAGVSYQNDRVDSADDDGPLRPRRFGKEKNFFDDSFNLHNLKQTLLFEKVTADFTGLYSQFDWNATDRLKLVLAARYDDSTLFDPQFSPKGALVFSINPEHTLRVTYNEAFQVPNYSEYFLQAETRPRIQLAQLEQFCLLDGIPCGFDVDYKIGENLALDQTPDTLALALGNSSLKPEEVKTWEAGYAGIFGGRAFLTVDYYRSENKNFVTDLLPQLGTALGRVNPNFPAYQIPAGLTPEHQAQLAAALQSALGPLRPFLSTNLDGTPILALASYTNFGQVDTQGVDVGFNWYFTNAWTLALSYSWFDFKIKDSRPGLDQLLLPNSPENKVSASLGYAGQRFDASLSGRWVDTFRWVVGPFQGDVKAYTVLDVVANYRISEHFELGLNVANALDKTHWEAFGGDILGRRVLGSLAFRW